MIRGLWAHGTDCIINVRVTDVDAKSTRSKDPYEVLAAHEREKKKKCLGACLEQRRHFSPFVVSTDCLLGKEAKMMLKKLSARLAEKWEKPCSEVCGHVNARMSIVIVRATHLCIRGSLVPGPLPTQLVFHHCTHTVCTAPSTPTRQDTHCPGSNPKPYEPLQPRTGTSPLRSLYLLLHIKLTTISPR